MDVTIPEDLLPDVTFACGPSQGHSDIRNSRLSDIPFERSHRAPDISSEGLLADATANIKKLLRIPDDYTVVFFLGGATPSLDAIAWNMTTDSFSGYCFGAFSNLWGKKIGAQLPDSVTKTLVEAPMGSFPSEKPDLNASFIFLTPNETSTGVAIPDSILTEVYDSASDNSVIGWDCTSCAGGRLLPADKYDCMGFSYQKCFGAPGGSGVLVLSPKAVKRAEEVDAMRVLPHSFRLAGGKMAIDRAVSKAQTVNTPSTLNIWMANEAAKKMLEAGGLEGMDTLVKDHAQILWDWAESSDYIEPFVEDPDFRSNLTPTFRIDDSIDAMDISKALKATGRPNLADGIKKYSAVEGNVIRIACFPFVDFNGTEQFVKLTKTVDYIVSELKK